MAKIDIKYEAWKNKLLDMGKRNRLLNYKDTARSNVKIESPDCIALWDMFVKNEIPLIFPLEKETEDGSEGEVDTKVASNVETNKSTSDLQKALRNLRNKAKTAIEEQGVNVLYLSFGFLNWTESENSDEIFKSPLILVPVSLTLESINAPYVLTLHEDEIILNPTLVYKLENDFGITLPAFDDSDDLGAFFNDVKSKTPLKNWSVSREVGLSLLSFLKINMYSDLKNHKETIVGNSIVRAISGDSAAITKIPEGIADYDFDKNEKPSDVFQVVDADASQQDAILMAKKGVSFVLQGPPGTGKSQTITNIIAESLADGKKVLFVSEKMAALDVVHRRLAGAGLDDFCLVLHSHKANKKSVLEQLSKVLDLSHKKVTLSDEAYHKLNALQADKTKLNDYAKQVYTIVEPLGKSIYEVNGIIANLETYDDFVFSVDDIRKITKEKYNKYTYLISQFASTMGKMTGDYKNNPWRECILPAVTNEFRHDAASKLNELMPKIRETDTRFGEILEELNLDAPHTPNSLGTIIGLLDCVDTAREIPSEWILSDEIKPLYDEVEKCMELKTRLVAFLDELVKECNSIRLREPSLPAFDVKELETKASILKEKNALSGFIAKHLPYSCWSVKELNEIANWINAARHTAEQINALKEELLRIYEPSVFEIDYRGMLARIKTEYTSFLKIFKKSYKQDKKTVVLHRKDIVKKISDEEMLALAEKLKNIDVLRSWYKDNRTQLSKFFDGITMAEDTDYTVLEKQVEAYSLINGVICTTDKIISIHEKIEDKETLLKKYYKFLYNGILSNWDLIRESLDWAVLFKNKVIETGASESFVKSVCCGGEFITSCREAKKTLEEKKNGILANYTWFTSKFDCPDMFDSMSFDDLEKRINACVNGLVLLEEWIDYRAVRAECVKNGLGDFIRVTEEHNVLAQNVLPVFKKRFFRLWLDAVLPEYPAVINFRRKSQEMTIEEFSNLDKVQFEIAKARIKGKLINALPSLEHFTSGVDEISILKRELGKQRRIMPIRRLFKAIPNLLLTLKPCLMMSPLSVSLFLEAETYKFDIVIFDEASQVCTENAIGAISRGKQVVIAGDSRQLPPTNFFQTAVGESDFDVDIDEDDVFDAADAYESILDEASMLPERTLRWHYRSRHESLIAFSNAKIYNRNLVTFPSNTEKVANNGVEYVYVPDGFYDRGGKKGNVIEANKVADLVFKHFREQPHRSLGIIAFGEAQQQAIENAIRERRLKNQEFEPFFAEGREEAFFVKNLENVQGDERDTIIFSIGYAKDSNGVFRMNFGPLNKPGGERRLNVAITRAKFNVKLVGSIMPTDINVDKVSSEGPKLLRAYIDFAMNGPSVLGNEIAENDSIQHDSPFESAVYDFLEKKGYRLGTQVGCSGYRIDMAVKHPTLSGIYVLGIECDGAAYHSARTARERDRLRQDVLENMGWKIYRIWSTDWIKDSATEGEKLVEAIEQAIESYGADSVSVVNDDESSGNVADFVNVEEKTLAESENPYGFERTQTVDFSSRRVLGDFGVMQCICEAVDKEHPIHYELLCQRVAPLFGNEKASVKVRREVDRLLLKLRGKVVRKGDFVFPAGCCEIVVRLPNERKIQHISKEELGAAMCRILQTCVGTTREALSTETARVYGFTRSGQNISAAMAEAVEYLIKTKKIEELEGKLRIKS